MPGSEQQQNRFGGKVVFISGLARGQGRQHAIDFAREGADIIGFDICDEVPSATAPTSGPEDLAETVRQVEALDRRIVAVKADARRYEDVQAAFQAGLEAFGRVDAVVGNAGITPRDLVPFWELGADSWRDTIDINLTGLWHTVKAAAPAMIAGGAGGAFVLTGSISGGKGWRNMGHYCSTKFGLVGLMKVMAIELAEHGIRANVVAPTNVDTPMFMNPVVRKLFAPEQDEPTVEQMLEVAKRDINLLPIGWVQPSDISAAVRWLCSDEARFVTGTVLPVDGGALTK